MTEKLIVTQLGNRNSSPVFEAHERGSVSTYTTPWGLPEFCGRYVNLQTAGRGALEDQEIVSPPLARGSILHTYYEHYHKDPENPGPFPEFQLPDDYREPLAEANRLWKAYRKEMPAWALGPTRMTEVLLPRTQVERMVLESAVGGATFKFICDSVVELNEKQISRLQFIDPSVQLPGPGLYVTDLKSEGRTRNAEDYELGLQGTAYVTCLDALRSEDLVPELGDAPLLGTIFVRVVALQTPKILLTFAPAPSEDERVAMRNFFRWRSEQVRADQPNFDACKGKFGKPCFYYRTGKCDRGAT